MRVQSSNHETYTYALVIFYRSASTRLFIIEEYRVLQHGRHAHT